MRFRMYLSNHILPAMTTKAMREEIWGNLGTDGTFTSFLLAQWRKETGHVPSVPTFPSGGKKRGTSRLSPHFLSPHFPTFPVPTFRLTRIFGQWKGLGTSPKLPTLHT